MFINAYDMARFGYLTLRLGKWCDRQLLSEKWVNMALTPTRLQSPYGFINYFLNTDREQWPSAPGTALWQRAQYGLYRSRERPCRGRALDRQQRRRWLSQAADRGGGGEELERSRVRPPATSAGGPARGRAEAPLFIAMRATDPLQDLLYFVRDPWPWGKPHEAARVHHAARRRGSRVAAGGARAA